MWGGRDRAKVRSMLRTALLSTAAAAAIALTAAGPASADVVDYVGKTSAGTDIGFKRDGATLSDLSAYLPTMCVSSRTSDTRSGSDPYILPSPVPLGTEQKLTAEPPTSMGMSSTATKNVHITPSEGPGGVITGKLHINFASIEPYYNAWGYLDGNTFVCQADATFEATPVVVEQPAPPAPAPAPPTQAPAPAKKKAAKKATCSTKAKAGKAKTKKAKAKAKACKGKKAKKKSAKRRA